ncbi:MFS transporter [Novosphingobium capsulatum]|uniref:MFS transporter n=2 Tax=Novosphingobium capsulatum TaxID=13688 RepID=UPI000AA3C2A4|nr:MFS transporter [Novosphingobium capsulatum]
MTADSQANAGRSASSRGAMAAALLIGTVGLVIAGVQPVFFGALLAADRLSAAQVGHVAAAELVSIGIGVVIAESFLERVSVWLSTLVALALVASLNLATVWTSGLGVLFVRGLVGLSAGVLVWMTTGVIVRSARPTALSAAFLLTQAIVQFATSTGLAIAAPNARDGVPVTIAVLAAAAMLLVPLLPKRLNPLPRDPAQVSGLPPLRGWVVLAASLLIQSCIVGAWVYFEPLGRQAGMTPQQVAFAVPASLGAQVVGGFAAIFLARRLPWFVSLIVSSIALSAVLFILSTPPGATAFFALETLFGAVWIFITPFLTPLSIENDPTRRTALLVPSAVLIGSGLGPLAASTLADDASAGRVLQLCALLAIGATLLIVGLYVTRSRVAGGQAAPHA